MKIKITKKIIIFSLILASTVSSVILVSCNSKTNKSKEIINNEMIEQPLNKVNTEVLNKIYTFKKF
ncbi:hypothetical protein [Mycoplasmopsis alligatoris]|uniref:Lipoprotein n=1 Tax=Mycoplasmopsis alligatoris A21JP2 TaxID=747682 RepID=D4XW87_9BACT|nr:hypothetical protein [Mycoplasmopsis alligatoris]EFF41385.1 hypothetical protein MALL_0750 [Mycoplasmopsis alligatoris A21JP2]